MRPIIGITSKYTRESSLGDLTGHGVKNEEWQLVSDGYVTAVTEAGGLPIIIPIYADFELAEELLPKLDGILFSGGSDLAPSYYGEEEIPEMEDTIDKLDAMEVGLCKKIMKETNMPVLGICRGLQLANVVMGGSLYQDITKSLATIGHSTEGRDPEPTELSHEVQIEKDSLLYSIVGQERIKVNSFHHQMVKKLGDNLRIVGKADDGIVEAMEYQEKDRFVLFVQWHPEMLAPENRLGDRASKSIMKAFVEACK